jgi:uncharacterized protein YdaU (DUF1376 family)
MRERSLNDTRACHPNGVKMCLIVKKLPSEVLKFFKEQGAKGGRIGGKRSLETMTAEQRAARAKKASKAAAEARKAKAKKAKGTTRKRVASGRGPVA